MRDCVWQSRQGGAERQRSGARDDARAPPRRSAADPSQLDSLPQAGRPRGARLDNARRPDSVRLRPREVQKSLYPSFEIFQPRSGWLIMPATHRHRRHRARPGVAVGAGGRERRQSDWHQDKIVQASTRKNMLGVNDNGSSLLRMVVSMSVRWKLGARTSWPRSARAGWQRRERCNPKPLSSPRRSSETSRSVTLLLSHSSTAFADHLHCIQYAGLRVLHWRCAGISRLDLETPRAGGVARERTWSQRLTRALVCSQHLLEGRTQVCQALSGSVRLGLSACQFLCVVRAFFSLVGQHRLR